MWGAPLCVMGRRREAGARRKSFECENRWFFLSVERGHHCVAAPHNTQAGPRRLTYAGARGTFLRCGGQGRRVYTAYTSHSGRGPSGRLCVMGTKGGAGRRVHGVSSQ